MPESTRYNRDKEILKVASQYRRWRRWIEIKLKRDGIYDIAIGVKKRPKAGTARATFDKKEQEGLLLIMDAIDPKIEDQIPIEEGLARVWRELEILMGFSQEFELLRVQALLKDFTPKADTLETVTEYIALTERFRKCGGTKTVSEKVHDLLSFLPESYYQWSLDVKTRPEYRVKPKKIASILGSPVSDLPGSDADDENEADTAADLGSSLVVRDYDWKKIVAELKLRAITDSTTRKSRDIKNAASAANPNNSKPAQQSNQQSNKSRQQNIKSNASKPGTEKTKVAKFQPAVVQLSAAKEKLRSQSDSKKAVNKESGKREKTSPDMVRSFMARQMSSNGTSFPSKILIDSGATSHCTSNETIVSNVTMLEKPLAIETLDGEVLAPKTGTINCTIQNESIELKNVILIPNASGRLDAPIMSVAKITQADHGVLFIKGGVYLLDAQGEIVLKGSQEDDGLFYFSAEITKEKVSVAVDQSFQDRVIELWHRRFGHRSASTIQRMQAHGSVVGLPKITKKSDLYCNPCGEHKIVDDNIPKEAQFHKIQSSLPGEKVHIDLTGPFPRGSHDNYFYGMIIFDDFSRYKWVFPLKSKSSAAAVIKQWVIYRERLSPGTLKNMKTDKGGEFISHELADFLAERGIIHDFIVTGCSYRNGAVERAVRTMKEAMLTMLKDANLSNYYWPFAFQTWAYLDNRCGSRVIGWKTPFELMYNKKPDVSHLRVFGSMGYAIDGKAKANFEPKGRKCFLLGYSPNHRAYQVLWDDNGAIGYVRTAKFHETSSGKDIKPDLDETSFPLCLEEDMGTVADSPPEQTVPAKQTSAVWGEVAEDNILALPRRNTQLRDRVLPEQLEIDTLNPKCFVGMAQEVLEDRVLTYADILKSPDFPEWKQSLLEEIADIEDVGECTVIDASEVPDGEQIIPVSLVFKVKPSGRKKSRVCGRGDKQRGAAKENYAPTVKHVSIRILVQQAAKQNRPLGQADVKCAFLNGRLDHPVYLHLPPGHPKKEGTKFVWKTYCSIYGLKNSPRVWYQTIRAWLKKIGFKQCPTDPGLFKLIKGNAALFLGLYVDDLLWFGTTDEIDSFFRSELKSKFRVTFEKNVQKFLGFDIERTQEGILLHQKS